MTNEAMFLDAGQSIFAVISAPDSDRESRNAGVVILNSGTIHNVGPFGLSVELGNGLTQLGFPVLRLDQTGKGESFTAKRKSNEMQTLSRDVRLAVSTLTKKFGVSKVAIVGLCSGADQGLLIADSIPETSALVMLDGWAPKDLRYYFARYLPKLRSPSDAIRSIMRRLKGTTAQRAGDDALLKELVDLPGRKWEQKSMRMHMQNLCQQQLPVLAVFTGDTDEYYSYEGQFCGNLSRMGADVSQVTEIYNRECKHLYPLVFQREKLIEEVTAWLDSVS